MQTINKEKVKKILIIKLRGIGDVILATIALPNIHRYFPNAKIDFLTENPSKAILETNKLISNIFIFNRNSLAERLKLFFIIRKQKYDLVIDFFSNPSTAQITFLSGAIFRAGFSYRGRKYAYNIYGPTNRTNYHAAQLHLEFLKYLGIPIPQKDLNIKLEPEDENFAEKFLLKNNLRNKNLVVISPSGGWPSKKCEPEKFAEIGKEIIYRLGYIVIVVWGPGDKEDATKITRLIGKGAFLAPPTSLREMGAIMKNSTAVIANDSGPMHLATALGVPVLSIHGPTNPWLQGPFGKKHEWVRLDELDCIECNLLECPRNHECFRDLPTETIFYRFKKLLNKNNIINA